MNEIVMILLEPLNFKKNLFMGCLGFLFNLIIAMFTPGDIRGCFSWILMGLGILGVWILHELGYVE